MRVPVSFRYLALARPGRNCRYRPIAHVSRHLEDASVGHRQSWPLAKFHGLSRTVADIADSFGYARPKNDFSAKRVQQLRVPYPATANRSTIIRKINGRINGRVSFFTAPQSWTEVHGITAVARSSPGSSQEERGSRSPSSCAVFWVP